jgi:hypothetical protein
MKILINNTASDVVLSDVGITVLASSSYTINTTDYVLFSNSSDTIVNIANGNLTVNDGSNDLSIAIGSNLILGGASQLNLTVGSLSITSTGGSGVDSFNGRTGIVFPDFGDYNAGQIGFGPDGVLLTSTDVQGAIDELAIKKINQTRAIALAYIFG